MLRRTEPVQQITTSVLIATCFALQLAGTVHLAVVEHELCAEHGVAIDVAQAHTHAHDTGASETHGDALASSGEGSMQSVPGAAHDHCPLAQDRNTRALVVQAASSGLRCEWAAPVVAAPVSAFRLSRDALRLLAPKTSPPA